MKIVNLGKDELSWGGVEELEEDPLIERVWYIYYEGSYDGYGDMLILSKDKWYVHSFSHCSCNGPLDDFKLDRGYDTLDEVLTFSSKEYQKDLQPLINAAIEAG